MRQLLLLEYQQQPSILVGDFSPEGSKHSTSTRVLLFPQAPICLIQYQVDQVLTHHPHKDSSLHHSASRYVPKSAPQGCRSAVTVTVINALLLSRNKYTQMNNAVTGK